MTDIKSFKGLGVVIGNVICLFPKEAQKILSAGKAVLIDLRQDYETNYRLFDVPEIIYISSNEIGNNLKIIPNDKPVILGDNVGMESRKIASLLSKLGFDNIAILAGGIIEWVKQGLPVKVDRNYELGGQCGCKIRPKNPKKASKPR